MAKNKRLPEVGDAIICNCGFSTCSKFFEVVSVCSEDGTFSAKNGAGFTDLFNLNSFGEEIKLDPISDSPLWKALK